MRATTIKSATISISRPAASLTRRRRRFWTALALITTAMTRTSCRSRAGKPSGSSRRSSDCSWCWVRWHSREYRRIGRRDKSRLNQPMDMMSLACFITLLHTHSFVHLDLSWLDSSSGSFEMINQEGQFNSKNQTSSLLSPSMSMPCCVALTPTSQVHRWRIHRDVSSPAVQYSTGRRIDLGISRAGEHVT